MGSGRDGICKTWGQYHFETFDGIYYYFPGSCSYIFAKDCGNLEPQYTVWVGGTQISSILKKNYLWEIMYFKSIGQMMSNGQ